MKKLFIVLVALVSISSFAQEKFLSCTTSSNKTFEIIDDGDILKETFQLNFKNNSIKDRLVHVEEEMGNILVYGFEFKLSINKTLGLGQVMFSNGKAGSYGDFEIIESVYCKIIPDILKKTDDGKVKENVDNSQRGAIKENETNSNKQEINSSQVTRQ